MQYLISSLLQTITTRIGYPQLGNTGIQYNLLNYHLSAEMEGGWSGAAVNFIKVADPKLDFAKSQGIWR